MATELFRIDTDEITGFYTKQQTELRKLFNRFAAQFAGGGTELKYYEEEGAATDSGTLLTGNEVAASVASVDSDLASSTSAVLLGGTNHLIDSGLASGILGGNSHTIESAFTSAIVAGSESQINTGADNAGILAGNTNTITNCSDAAIVGGQGNAITGGNQSVILGGSNNVIPDTGIGAAVVGDTAYGHRAWTLTVGGGATTNLYADVCQAGVLSGATSTPDNFPSPAGLYFGNVGGILMLPNSVVSMTGTITAVRVSDFASQMIVFTAHVRRIGSAAPVLISYDEVSNDGNLAGVSVAAGVTADSFTLIPTGLAATTISWTSSVLLNEVRIG